MNTHDHNEPVAWMGIGPRDGRYEFCKSKPAPSVMRDFNMQPLYTTPPDAAAQIAKLEAERNEWKDCAVNGGNAGYLREQIAKLEAQLAEARKVRELSDEQVLEIAKDVNLNNEAMGFIWNQDIPVRYIQQFCVVFARAVLKEGE